MLGKKLKKSMGARISLNPYILIFKYLNFLLGKRLLASFFAGNTDRSDQVHKKDELKRLSEKGKF